MLGINDKRGCEQLELQNNLTAEICSLQSPAEKLQDEILHLWEGLKLVAEAALKIAASFMEACWRIAKIEYETKAAISWARSVRPKWYAIYCRSKKKRIRKKYEDRIIREYRRVQENG